MQLVIMYISVRNVLVLCNWKFLERCLRGYSNGGEGWRLQDREVNKDTWIARKVAADSEPCGVCILRSVPYIFDPA